MSYFPAPIPQPVTATAGDFAVTAVGIVGVTQATSPWVTTSTISGISTVTGTVFATLAGTSVVAGIVSATQGTSPWIVAGTVSATQGTSPWVVSAAAIGATQSGVWAVNSTVTSIPGVGPTGTTAPTTAIVNGIIVSGTLQAVSSTFPMPVSGTVTAEIEGHGGATLDAAPGAAIPTNAVMVGGSDGTDLRAIATDTGGQVKVLIENASAIPVSLSGNQAVNIAQALGSTLSKTNGVFVVPGDNTNSITMKAASTQSATTDTSLVVQINPNQPNLTTALNVQDTADGPVSAGVAAGKSMLTGGVVATSAASGTAAQQMATQMDVAGNLRINPFGNTGSFVTVTANGTYGSSAPTMFTVPSGKKWVFKSCQIEYTAANSGSARTVGIYVQGYDTAASATYSVAGMSASATLAINTAAYYTIAPSIPLGASFVNLQTTIPFPEVVLGPGSVIVLQTLNAVSTDAWTCGLNVIQLND